MPDGTAFDEAIAECSALKVDPLGKERIAVGNGRKCCRHHSFAVPQQAHLRPPCWMGPVATLWNRERTVHRSALIERLGRWFHLFGVPRVDRSASTSLQSLPRRRRGQTPSRPRVSK